MDLIYFYLSTMENIQTYLDYTTLNNGIKIPVIGLGSSSGKEFNNFVYTAIKSGVRLIDTAWKYNNESEIGVGIKKALDEKIIKREELFIITKLWPTEFHRGEECLKEQLKSLQVDYVDLYLVHWPIQPLNTDEKQIPLYKIWEIFEGFVDKKLTRSIGVSNFNVQLLLDLISYARILPAVNEVEFHPYFQQNGLFDFCNKFGIKLIAYNSLVSGTYALRDGEINKYQIFKEQTIIDLSKKYNKTGGQILLAWAITKGIIVIPKTNSETRVVENQASSQFRLESDDMQKISSLNMNKRFCQSNFDWFSFFDAFA
jgi:diketogulonate reductase-like aldo/keto reductase